MAQDRETGITREVLAETLEGALEAALHLGPLVSTEVARVIMVECDHRIAHGHAIETVVSGIEATIGRASVFVRGQEIEYVIPALLVPMIDAGFTLSEVTGVAVAIRDALQAEHRDETLLRMIMTFGAMVGWIFFLEPLPDPLLVPREMLREPLAVKTAVEISLHTSVHANESGVASIIQVLTNDEHLLGDKRYPVLLALNAVARLRVVAKPRQIHALALFLGCLRCLYGYAVSVERGTISGDLHERFVRQIPWFRAKHISPREAVGLLESFMEYGGSLSLQAYYELVAAFRSTLKPPDVGEFLKIGAEPRTIERAAEAMRRHALTSAWVLGAFRNQTALDLWGWIDLVARFGAYASGIAADLGTRAPVFLRACEAIGEEDARKIARRVELDTVADYVLLRDLRREYPECSWSRLVVFVLSGQTFPRIRVGLEASLRFGVPDEWLLFEEGGRRETPELAALEYFFAAALAHRPSAFERRLFASASALQEIRRRGLKRVLRRHGEWLAEARRQQLVRSAEPAVPAVSQERVEEARRSADEETRLVRSWSFPADPVQMRLWMGWRIVQSMWVKKEFGAKNVNPFAFRKLVPNGANTALLEQALDCLIKDGIVLSRPGKYTRISLNPRRLVEVHLILAGKCPAEGSFAQWVNRG